MFRQKGRRSASFFRLLNGGMPVFAGCYLTTVLCRIARATAGRSSRSRSDETRVFAKKGQVLLGVYSPGKHGHVVESARNTAGN